MGLLAVGEDFTTVAMNRAGSVPPTSPIKVYLWLRRALLVGACILVAGCATDSSAPSTAASPTATGESKDYPEWAQLLSIPAQMFNHASY